jgi:hypothetical protein
MLDADPALRQQPARVDHGLDVGRISADLVDPVYYAFAKARKARDPKGAFPNPAILSDMFLCLMHWAAVHEFDLGAALEAAKEQLAREHIPARK